MQLPLSQPGYAVAVRDVVYRQTAGRSLRGLMYQPKGEGPFPAVVCVHGGAWVSGDRTATQGFADLVAACGIVVMAIDFRMAPSHPYPSSLVDINFATRWLKQHAAEHAVDADIVGGLGVSSGGHLILLSALRPSDARYAAAKLEGGDALDASLAFVVTCSGVLDPLARYEMAEKQGNTEIMACHEAYFATREVMAEASPPLLLASGEGLALPPALFFQGGADPRLPPDTAERTAQALVMAGGQAEAIVYAGVGHALGEWGRGAIFDVLHRTSRLIAQVNACRA